MIAALAGFGIFIVLNVVLALVYSIACGSSQFLNMVLRFSYLSLPIKLVCWFGAAWAGMSVWEAMG
jgi:hypothetical protein